MSLRSDKYEGTKDKVRLQNAIRLSFLSITKVVQQNCPHTKVKEENKIYIVVKVLERRRCTTSLIKVYKSVGPTARLIQLSYLWKVIWIRNCKFNVNVNKQVQIQHKGKYFS